ncbi:MULTISPECIES: hypothetical protein [unclassified Rickettsia]
MTRIFAKQSGVMPWLDWSCCMALKKCRMSFPRRRESRKNT